MQTGDAMTTHSLLRRLGVGVGAPLALAAILGTGIVLAQQGDGGGTETPSDGGVTPNAPDNDKGSGRHSGDDCPKDGSGDSSGSDAAVRSGL